MKLYALFAILFATPSFANECEWPAAPKKLAEDAWVWEVGPSLVQSDELPHGAYEKFAAWAKKQPNLDTPYQKLQALRDEYEKHGWLTPEIQSRVDPILQNKMGQLRRVNCVEALLMGEASARGPMFEKPFEYISMIVQKAGLWKVYLVLGKATSADMTTIQPQLNRDLKQGGKVFTNMHNHPFSLKEGYILQSGYTAPSPSDVRSYKNWNREFGLPEARITNGIYTLILRADEFWKMSEE